MKAYRKDVIAKCYGGDLSLIHILHFAAVMAEAFEDEDREPFMRRLALAMQKINEESHVVLDEEDDFANTNF